VGGHAAAAWSIPWQLLSDYGTSCHFSFAFGDCRGCCCDLEHSRAALSMHERSVKHRAAQTAKTLNGMTWKEFRRAECGPDAAAAPTGASTKAAATVQRAITKAA
jgi:hypothetical protein